MLRLDSISLYQFKNYPESAFAFPERVMCICGRNGAGKTNLLDAIHYLCFTRSYFTRMDANNVMQGRSGFRVQGQLRLTGKDETAVCLLRETGKKEMMVNGDAYDKFSRHIGRYTCVVIAPDDARVITGGSEERRAFLDALLAQLDAAYLQQLIIYNKVLQQRNSLLRQFAEQGRRDLSLLDVLDAQLADAGDLIAEKRRVFLLDFLPEVLRLYNLIAEQEEPLMLVYESQLQHGSMAELLAHARNKDLQAQRSTMGIHRDELDFKMGHLPFRSIASQGQRKSLLFALKLSELEVLRREKGFAPLLLLDDVFEKLDEERIGNLLKKVCVENDGQIFITDTNEERLKLQMKKIGVPYGMIRVE